VLLLHVPVTGRWDGANPDGRSPLYPGYKNGTTAVFVWGNLAT